MERERESSRWSSLTPCRDRKFKRDTKKFLAKLQSTSNVTDSVCGAAASSLTKVSSFADYSSSAVPSLHPLYRYFARCTVRSESWYWSTYRRSGGSSMTARYEPPDHTAVLTREDIRRRYQDTSLLIFNEQQNRKETINYLSFGSSRRTMEYSSNGNQPVIVRRPTDSLTNQNRHFSSQISKIYQKPRESCVVT
ncbi:hypothetical protein KM043_013213 [Ampulex compressa]|nr:hypothetical protein KM043_013213 [Ampulex compressa]